MIVNSIANLFHSWLNMIYINIFKETQNNSVIYLHHLLQLDQEEMLNNFFYAQWENPVKADWALEVKENLIEFTLPTDVEQIKRFSEKNSKIL